MLPILTHAVRFEQDVVSARQRGRMLAEELGFEPQDQARIATSVSEIVRNAFRYAGGGRISFAIEDSTIPQTFVVTIEDSGKGIEQLDLVLAGKYKSATGMGIGLMGTKRLMDNFEVQTGPKGTVVTFSKNLSPRAKRVLPEDIDRILRTVSGERAKDPFEEVQRQNQELLRALEELQERQNDLNRLNRELEDTNRGVVALYAELDEKADHLRRADEIKSRFLSNMSHEFRTPLNSILALSRILLDRTDGNISQEQEIQINFIRKAAQDLSELVNDLLDLAKVEAGKIEIHPVEFEVEMLFGALRGMLRPLLLNESVQLVFEDASDIPVMYSDEGKVSQILRNLISNALKFTERGEVRIRAFVSDAGDTVHFQVVDTGIGIPLQDLERVFQEFTQVHNPTQRKVKGTGLGLPLSRKLAELLGGTLTVESRQGEGSMFTATLPIHYLSTDPAPEENPEPSQSNHKAIVLLEHLPEDVLVFEKLLKDTPFTIYSAYSVKEARAIIERVRPLVVILDIVLKGEEAWTLLRELKPSNSKSVVPVIVLTQVDDRDRAMALGADAFFSKPLEPEKFLETLLEIVRSSEYPTALMIDDEEISRYLLRQMLVEAHFLTIEADNGPAGIDLALKEKPDVIFLDVVMPGMKGFEVLKHLRERAETKNIPVIMNTSLVLSNEERAILEGYGAVILSKEVATRSDALAAMQHALKETGVLR